MEQGNMLFMNGKTYLLLTIYFVLIFAFKYVDAQPQVLDFVHGPLKPYSSEKPSIDNYRTRAEMALGRALLESRSALKYGLPTMDNEFEKLNKEDKTLSKLPRATRQEVDISRILYWRIRTDRFFHKFDISLEVLEKLVMELFRKYGFNIANCQSLLEKEGIPNDKALDFCYNLEPFSLLECRMLTWLDFSVVMDIKFRMKRRGMFLETKDVCRLVERVKPSLIPKPEKKSIFGKCQTVVNTELMSSYGITNMDADMICTVMDYTIQPSCSELSKEELSQVMKLGLHLGNFLYPRIFPLFVGDLCIARKMMKRGPSREKCRNSLIRVLIERADELDESILIDWTPYTDAWRACAYVYKRKALKSEKSKLDREFSLIAFGLRWSDSRFRGKDRDYEPSPLAQLHGDTVEELPEESSSESSSELDLGSGVGSESSVDLGSDLSMDLEGSTQDSVVLGDDETSLDLSMSEYDSVVLDTKKKGLSGTRYIKGLKSMGRKGVSPRERWATSKKPIETPDQFLWPSRQSVALNSVQKSWAQILYSLYSDSGNKAYGIEDFELVASRIDPVNLAKSCARLIYAKIKKYPGTQKDGEASRFSESTIANWCAAIDGARSQACQNLSTPAFIWSKNILKSVTSFRDESSFAVDLRDICRLMLKLEPWNYTKKSGFTNKCLHGISEPLSIAKNSSKISFSEKYKINEKESKQICLLMKPANHRACMKLNSADLTFSYKLAYHLGKISKDDKKLQMTYDAACRIVTRVGRDGTSQHCILATAEFVGIIAVDSGVSGKEFEKGVVKTCEKLFEAREPEEGLKLVTEIIDDIFSDISKNMPPQPQDYDVIRKKIIVGDELIEEARNIRGLSRLSPTKVVKEYEDIDERFLSPTYFKPNVQDELRTPFGIDPDILKRKPTQIVSPGDGYYEESVFPTQGLTISSSWVNISEVNFKKSLEEKLKEEFTRIAPASTVMDSKNIPNFAEILKNMDLSPNNIYVSCVKALKRKRIRSEVAELVCKRIDPYSTPACHGLMIVLLDHAEAVHAYLTSLVKKDAFDLSDICKVIYILNPLSNKSGEIGHIANSCVKSPIMFSFQRKYSLNNNQMTKLCSKVDFTRTQSFARLNKSQRTRVILSSKVISSLIADSYQNVYKTHSGVFWARNIPRVSVENMINLVSHTGIDAPEKEKCEYECQVGKPFYTQVLRDVDICFKACMSEPSGKSEDATSGVSTGTSDLKTRELNSYLRYGSTEDAPIKKAIWWLED